MSIKKSASNVVEKILTYEEQQAKINEVRSSLGTLSGKSSVYCSDASIARHLTARNWNVKKATKMLKETLKWRSEYKPEEIRWEEVAKEAETGKIYRSNYVDKHGRTVLVMRPSCQNSKSTKGQIRYLVYCMENAVLNLPPHQDKMVWLIDFQGFNMSHISVKVTKETAHVLQDHYPERLGLAILYNPPKFFEPFFTSNFCDSDQVLCELDKHAQFTKICSQNTTLLSDDIHQFNILLLADVMSVGLILCMDHALVYTLVKPFLEPKTYNKVKFAYSDDLNAKKIMEDLFDMDKLESAFGGNDTAPFDINKYAERMKEDDKKMPALWGDPQSTLNKIPSFVSTKLGSDSESSDNEKTDSSKRCGSEPELVSSDDSKPLAASSGHSTEDVHGTKPEVFSSDNSIPVAASSRNPAEVV
ncbi:hypothetical protein FEM48_Zijuj06G0118200 [Ziziphus jujuba var. spinosa]|uniref:CRAL-TRIO domain-containing protein n=1 Tax=Ziziphus jujuba var. spinosa TaxID=714518 RepID=A0A978V944_ZIZJJ|nr:hypothetical protein FEM48_Zijuj06G0118200 [Ziziphus jujuba var. spinosa]